MQFKIYDRIKYEKDTSAQNLKKYIESLFQDEADSLAYYQEPDYWTESNLLPTFTVCSKKYGVFIFKTFDYSSDVLSEITDRYWMVNGQKRKNEILDFEDYCFKLNSDIELPSNDIFTDIPVYKFVVFPMLEKQNLVINIKRIKVDILFSDYRAQDITNGLELVEFEEGDWERLKSVIQKSNVLTKESNLIIDTPIQNLREAIAYNNQKIHLFDEEQLDASMTITEGAQRIRGLAGSGKTVILSIKAARLHRKDPEAKIAYVFSTHSLYKQVTDLINKYYAKLTGEKLNPKKLEIIHSWGGRTVGPGFYYNVCQSNGVIPLTVRDLYGFENKFDEACKRLLKFDLKEEYDHVLIDEAQDMPLSFFKLVEKVTKKPKNIIWAYDDLQTTNATKIPEVEELFGVNEDQTAKVPLIQENDYILNKSYRNHKNVLMTAVAYGFGMYSESGLVQIINDKSTWNALGFKIEGDLTFDSNVKIIRPEENSPNTINSEYKKYPITNIIAKDNFQEEIDSVAQEIIRLISEEFVKPEDIMVIDMNNRAKARLQELQGLLYKDNIESLIPGMIDGAKDFFKEGCVTLTTVRRAKGNEVPVVFMLGCDMVYRATTPFEKRMLRNMLFISMTRSKGWLFISGNGPGAIEFIKEYEAMKDDINEGIFNFKFPSKEEFASIEQLNLLTMDSKKAEKLQSQAEALNEIISGGDLSSLKMFLDESTIEKLKSELFKGK